MTDATPGSARPAGRVDGRRADQLRPLRFQNHIAPYATGSTLIEWGNTRVICGVTVEEMVPKWMKEQNVSGGWITAEYSMLPYSTLPRKQRDIARGKIDGRSQEIQRLIGRAMRAAVNLEKVGPRTFWIDCDVLQADGGTRCAAITGAYVAARRALDKFGLSKALSGSVAAVSVGIVDGEALLDLDYSEDSQAEVDMNVVMSGDGALVEVQATAEKTPFSRARLDELLELAAVGIEELAEHQEEAVAAARV